VLDPGLRLPTIRFAIIRSRLFWLAIVARGNLMEATAWSTLEVKNERHGFSEEDPSRMKNDFWRQDWP
jgi:hypothetical protein